MQDPLNCNPWLSIWVKPRETIQKISNFNPKHRLWVLSFIYGFISLMGLSQSFSYGFFIGFWPLMLLAIIIAPLWGYFLFSLGAGIVYFTGKWLKGKGSFSQVRAVISWSTVPMIVNLFIWILLIIQFRIHLFQGFYDTVPLEQTSVLLLFVLTIIQLIMSIWSLVIFISSLSQIQKFSILRSISNFVLSVIIFFFISFALLILHSWIFMGVMKATT